MNKQEALDLMQKLIGSEYSRLDDMYTEALQFRDWSTCDNISLERISLIELHNFIEKEYRGE